MFARFLAIVVSVAVLCFVCTSVVADCADDPMQQSCANFTLNSTEVNANVSAICAINPNYTACLAHEMCHHTPNPAVSGDVRCRHFSHLRLLCQEADVGENCARLRSMCQEGSMVLACSRPWLDVPTFGALTDPLIALCNNQSSPVYNSEGCGLCQTNGEFNYECPRFDSWALACQNASNPRIPGCETWVDLCLNGTDYIAPYSVWDFCGYVMPAQAPVNPNATCLENPLSHSCHQYLLPTVEADIADLCGMMPNMPGCALNQLCLSNATINATSYCQNRFAVLKVLCTDMPGMSGCNNYKQLCQNGSMVDQCNTLIPNLPMTMYLSSTVQQFCAAPAAAIQSTCASCPVTSTCNLLATYSGICQRVNDTRCEAWNTACASPGLSSWAWCQPYVAPAPAVTSTPSAKAPTKPATPAASAASLAINLFVLVASAFVVLAL
eukprot:TRINITY_DN3514_c0_g3_i1.p2 TRINITY_DN3514_c0_g3~~TRINITY_DN3514_c0_g3_i1.p2  ORF type:complete len:439 (+),score=44.56 TRINITY_DN3514_c0_g3_i1:2143-3459(+)